MTVLSATTIPNLQSLRGRFTPGDVVEVDGFTTMGDGGGGAFYFEGTAPAAATITGATAASFAIMGATNASPIVITAPGHSFVTGQSVLVQNVIGSTAPTPSAANGSWLINKLSASTFELVGSHGNGTYVSSSTAASVTVSTSADHGLVPGALVMIAGAVGTGGFLIDGRWFPLGKTTATTFTIPAAPSGSYSSGGLLGDGGLSIPSTALNGRWLRRAGTGVFNVKWFGAAGDGSTDDVGAIRTAIIRAKTLPTTGGGQ